MIPKAKLLLLNRLRERQPGWHIKSVDLEKCVCRTIGPYEVEISGDGRNPHRFHIYVWKKDPVYRVIERHTTLDLRKTDIAALAADIAERYAQQAISEGVYSPPVVDSSDESEDDVPF